ncbi:MAG: hypothetical protein PHS49_07365 [Candidatus Gracilibacteria bacterium]|nr:hypothetical protein [Candidatus Gracilibacteria bacterium]
MKKVLLISLLLVASLGLVSCGSSDAPLTEAEQAEKVNMTIEEYRETKNAAAKMNMTVDNHMNMTDNEGSENTNDMMESTDDSDMIE